jgi:hypothetical protein
MRAVIDSLPSPSSPEPKVIAATGTDGSHINERVALPLPYAGDGTGRIESEAGGSTLMKGVKHKTPETPTDEGFGRVLSAFDGSKTERGGFLSPLFRKPLKAIVLRCIMMGGSHFGHDGPSGMARVISGCLASFSVQFQHSHWTVRRRLLRM